MIMLQVIIRPSIVCDDGNLIQVIKDVPPNVVAFGNPCKVQRSVFENRKG